MRSTDRLPLVHLLVPLAAGVALASYAAAQVEAAAAAETKFLAILVCAVLLPVAALARPPAVELGLGALLATLAAWVVPAGPARGAAIGVVLAGALATAAGRRLHGRGEPISWPILVPLALGLQLLARAELLLGVGLEPRTLLELLGLPLLAAAAAGVLAADGRGRQVLIGCGAAFLLAPGWSLTVTLSLAALAAGALLRRAPLAPAWRTVAALILFVAACFWNPALALLLAAAAAVYALEATATLVALVVLAGAGAAIFLPAARGWSEVLGGLALVPLLLPAMFLPAPNRRPLPVLGALLAVVALRVVPGVEGLAAPLVLAALGIRGRRGAASLQGLWTGLAVAGTALAAGYPWLRAAPLEDFFALFSLAPRWPPALLAAALLTLLGLAHDRGRLLWRRQVWPAAALGAALLALAAFWSLPPVAVQPLGPQARTLNAGHPTVVIDLERPAPLGTLVIDTYLDNAARLDRGTPVAEIRVVDAEGRRRRWRLLAGVHTGEWAARRPDVAALPGFSAPPPWVAWVAPGGEAFAQRYRARWRLEEPMTSAVWIKIVRARKLPPEVSLALFHLELRP